MSIFDIHFFSDRLNLDCPLLFYNYFLDNLMSKKIINWTMCGRVTAEK